MSLNHPNDNEKLRAHFLVLRSQVGDNEAFEELYGLFKNRTLRLLFGLLKSDLADDLNQEVWLVVYKRIASLDDAGRFRTWLFQITRNAALDHFRKTKRMNEFHEILRNDQEIFEDTSELNIEMPFSTRVNAAMEQLSAKLREVIVLNYYEGMDYEEMALILGLSIGTVKSRLFNARNKIKELIKQ